LNRQDKERVVAQMAAVLAESQAVILTDFKGLKVQDMQGLRQKIAEVGGEYQVVKNTLLKLAAKGTFVETLAADLSGNNGLSTTAADPVPLAKAIVDFAKSNDKLVVKGGALSGQTLTMDQIRALASLPAREVLLAQLFGTMNAVPGGFVRVLAAVIQKLAYALVAIKDQKEQTA